MDGSMEDTATGLLRQRLVGLGVLLALVFLLSLLLPSARTPEAAEPSTTVSVTGEQVLTEADAVPPPDDLPAEDASLDDAPVVEPAVTIADVGELHEAPPEAVPPAVPPKTALKLAPKVASTRRAQDQAEPRPAPKPPAVVAVTPKPKLAESVSAPAPPKSAHPAAGWYVQVGSFSDLGGARTIVTLLGRLGVTAGITQITGRKGNALNRVRAGPYPNEAAARTAQAKIARNGYPQAQVVQEPSH